MKTLLLDYARVPGYSNLFLEFLQSDSLDGFYGPYPRGCSGLRVLAAERRQVEFPRAEISEALRDFNRNINNSAAAAANAARLADDGVLGVVTGQQAGLFGGPALTFYKAITAILLAEKLDQDGFPTVPVFWIASEDHDFEEIRRTTFIDSGGAPVDLQLDDESDSPLPAAWRKVTRSSTLLKRVEEILGTAPHAGTVLQWLYESHVDGYGLDEAFGRVLAKAFGSRGLVLIDSNDPAVRRLSAPYYAQAIEQAEQVGHLLEQRNRELLSAGFQPQVHWEPDYTLLFHLGTDGRRAIRRSNGQFAAGTIRWDEPDLVGEIREHPDRFSPSALLRPIIQDAVLPSVVYVGGPAEVAYFAQLRALSPVFGWVPVIQPRLSVIWLDPRTRRYLERGGLDVVDLFCPLEELQQKMVLRKVHPGVFSSWDQHCQNVAGEMESLFELAHRLDPTLAGAWQTSRRKVEYQLDKTRRKMLRSAAMKDQTQRTQAEHLHNLVYPGGVAQERRINFLSFYARSGPAMLETLLSLSPCERSAYLLELP